MRKESLEEEAVGERRLGGRAGPGALAPFVIAIDAREDRFDSGRTVGRELSRLPVMPLGESANTDVSDGLVMTAPPSLNGFFKIAASSMRSRTPAIRSTARRL